MQLNTNQVPLKSFLKTTNDEGINKPRDRIIAELIVSVALNNVRE